MAEAVYEESRVGGFDPLCQLGDIIGFAVPGRERKEIVGEGIERFGVIRVYQCLEAVLRARDSFHLRVDVERIDVFGTQDGEVGRRLFIGCRRFAAELDQFFHDVSADFVILIHESDHLADFRFMAFLFFPVRLRSILVGIAQGLFEIEVGDIAEAAACQADGFFFRDVATVALVAEAVKEIVPVSGFKAFFPSGVFHGFAEV